jgi:hypothetical protein
MAFELKAENVSQFGDIDKLEGTNRRLWFKYRATIVGLADELKYRLPNFEGSVDIDLSSTGLDYEIAMFNEATALFNAQYNI